MPPLLKAGGRRQDSNPGTQYSEAFCRNKCVGSGVAIPPKLNGTPQRQASSGPLTENNNGGY